MHRCLYIARVGQPASLMSFAVLYCITAQELRRTLEAVLCGHRARKEVITQRWFEEMGIGTHAMMRM